MTLLTGHYLYTKAVAAPDIQADPAGTGIAELRRIATTSQVGTLAMLGMDG